MGLLARRRFCPLAALLLALAMAASHAQVVDHSPVRMYPKTGALEFSLHDEIDSPIYAWPRTLLTYPVDFSACKCTERQLHLLGSAGAETPFQMSEARSTADGRLTSAKVSFFAELGPGQTQILRLAMGEDRVPRDDAGVTEKKIGDAIEVDAGLLQVRLPASQSVKIGDATPAPILALNRGQGWVGQNTLLIEDASNSTVTQIKTRLLDSGSLFHTYEVAYLFGNGATYTATLSIVQGYPFVLFSEQMENITPDMGMALNMDWDGLKPTRRFAANGWMQPRNELGIDEPVTTPGIIEEPHWFPADRVEDPGKEMIFHLAAFEGNAPRDAVPAMSFWEQGPHGQELSVFVPDTATWDDRQYMIWQPTTRLQVSFRHVDGHLIWHWPLVSGRRQTAIALTSTLDGEQVMQRERATYAAAGKEYRHAFEDNGAFSQSSLHARYAEWMRAWYGSLDLDRVKDWVLTYPASARQAPAPLLKTSTMSVDPRTQAAKFESKVLHSALMDYPLGSNLGIMNISHRMIRPIVEEYMQVRGDLKPPQKARIDALLLLSAYINAGDDLAPSRTTLSGTANMSADGFSVPSEVGILFPDHPMGPEWRDQFQKIVQLDATFYTRPDVPAYHSLGGRWAESLATYNWAYFVPVLTAQIALTHTDGINRIASDALAQRGRWMVDELSAPIYNPDPYWRQGLSAQPSHSPWKAGMALTPANGFERQYPSHGAHGSGTGIIVPYDVPILAKYLRNYDPLIAEHLLWAYAQRTSTQQSEGNEMFWRAGVLDEMKGNTGTNPHLRSSKYTGHGIILRNGVDTSDEVSVHLDQIDQGPNYRWGDNGEGSSGVLYFFGYGQPWAGHERENTGDHNNDDATGTTTFAVLHDHAWRSIGENVLDQPLYDLGFAQYGEIAARHDHQPYSWPAYRSRSVMLVGTDYFILADDADGETRFSWFTAYDLPFPKIVFLEPLSARADHWTEVSTAMSKGFIRDAAGPSMVLVTHKKQDVAMERMSSKPVTGLRTADIEQYSWTGHVPPAKGVFYVRTATTHDRVFRSFDTIRYAENDEAFIGKAGFIRAHQDGTTELALIRGTAIAVKYLRLELPSAPETNVAVAATLLSDGEVRGTYCNLELYPVPLTLTSGIAANAIFFIDGEAIQKQKHGEVWRVELPSGRHQWQLSADLPIPLAPSIERTINQAGGAEVFFGKVAGADQYRLEVSTDGGVHWRPAAHGIASPLALSGLRDSAKIHVRVIASNSDRESPPGDEYPIYITAAPPASPDGLDLILGKDTVTLHWGEVLGAAGYRLFRRNPEQGRWKLIYSGGAHAYVDSEAKGVLPANALPGAASNPSAPAAVAEYAISAFNKNGEGVRGTSANTAPSNWRNWWPAGQTRAFKRQTGFWLPPYVPDRTFNGTDYEKR